MKIRWMVAGSVVLAVLSMFCYPGGTPLDKQTTGYSLTHNFLSDLGMTVSYSNAPNRLGAALFVASLLLLVAGAVVSVSIILRRMYEHRRARRWIRAAAICAGCACVAFTGVAFSPENSAWSAHLAFTFWGWRFVPLVAACVGMALLRSRVVRPRLLLSWMVLTGLLAAYVAVQSVGPSVDTESGLVIQVIAQKLAAVVVIAAVLLLTRVKDEQLFVL